MRLRLTRPPPLPATSPRVIRKPIFDNCLSPQMISTNHPNAEYYFDRDVECVRTFFKRRFGFAVEWVPTLFSNVIRSETLDVELAASGWTQAGDEL